MSFDPERHPHRRLNPLTGQWVLVSPHRTKRPWQGQVEAVPPPTRPVHDPTCYLCPGNVRAQNDVNPAYTGTFVFDNDFSALLPEEAAPAPGGGEGPLVGDARGLLRAAPVSGICRVICFSPRHDLTLAEMEIPAIVEVVDTWASETARLGERYPWVQVFENKGAVMGCSNPHPHGQVWASSSLPNEAVTEDRHQRDHLAATGRGLLLDYGAEELADGARVVCQNEDWLVVVPFWAVWPYETLFLPRFPVGRMPDLSPRQRLSLAQILRQLLAAYDRLFDVTFPYSMGWHGAPYLDSADSARGGAPHWLLHAHAYPPLLRSATVKKFMVGYEMLAEPQRDVTPEQAAERLRRALGST